MKAKTSLTKTKKVVAAYKSPGSHISGFKQGATGADLFKSIKKLSTLKIFKLPEHLSQ